MSKPEMLSRLIPSAAEHGAFQAFAEPGVEGGPRVPLIAVAGETNSGKTTLVNFLLKAQLLTVDIVANTHCPTLVRFGHTAHLKVCLTDGTTALRSLADLHRLGREGVQFIEVFLPSPVLRQIAILDLPGLDSLADAEAQSRWIKMADIQIWCTAATQAWKASEQAMWTSLARPRRAGLLALTHKDLLTQEQLGAVGERLSRETRELFFDWSAIAASEAMAARNPRGEVVNNIVWRSTGVEDFIGKLKELLRDVVARRDETRPETAHPAQEPPPAESATPQSRLTSRALQGAAAGEENAHPVLLFAEVSQRILDAARPGLAHKEVAALMAREFEAYRTRVLKPWLSSRKHLAAAGAIQALIPASEAEILGYLAPQAGEPAAFSAEAILTQLQCELAESFIANQ
jgi:hypothetical protein